MQNVAHIGAGRAAGVEAADVALNEGKTLPGVPPHQIAHHVQIFLVSGKKIVQPHDRLPETQQAFKQVGADKARYSGHQPARGLRGKAFAQLCIGVHVCILWQKFCARQSAAGR